MTGEKRRGLAGGQQQQARSLGARVEAPGSTPLAIIEVPVVDLARLIGLVFGFHRVS
jgi:hypothetical protein